MASRAARFTSIEPSSMAWSSSGVRDAAFDDQYSPQTAARGSRRTRAAGSENTFYEHGRLNPFVELTSDSRRWSAVGGRSARPCAASAGPRLQAQGIAKPDRIRLLEVDV